MKTTFLAIALAVVALFATACDGNNESDISLIHNPNSAAGYDSTVAVPRILFDQEQHDFGRLSAGEQVTYSFHFRNTGNADLVITGCDVTCGCTIANYPKGRIAPGGDGYITVSFHSPGRSGQQMKEVTVNTNAQPSSVKLRILAQVN